MAFGKNIDQRKTNKRNHIIDLFRQHSILSKATARNYSHYSMDTIISIFDQLIKDKAVIPAEGEQKIKGRRAVFYSLNSDRWFYLGLTFNQSGIYSAVMSFSYSIKDKHFTPLRLGISKDEFIAAFITHVKAILMKNKAYDKSVIAVGCSVPGDIDVQSGILHSYTFIPSLKDMNFHELLQSVLPKTSVTINHNIYSMTTYLLREKELITAYPRILFISARSGAGSGYVHNGTIVTGHGEFGHIKVTDEDTRCICGRSGCLDCYFSYRSFIDTLSRHTGSAEPVKSAEEEFAGINLLADLYGKGNPSITAELDRCLRFFTMALLDVINVMAPDIVILTGELFKVYGDPVKAITDSVQQHYKDTGYVTNFHNTALSYREMSTEIASLGICFEMIHRDWDYTKE